MSPKWYKRARPQAQPKESTLLLHMISNKARIRIIRIKKMIMTMVMIFKRWKRGIIILYVATISGKSLRKLRKDQ